MREDELEFDAPELAKRAGVTPRTIYYYAQQGLIPAAAGTGPGPKYGRRHLLRLLLIKRLQQQHLPLAEIASRLKALDDREVAGLLEEGTSQRPRGSSALDYVRSVLAEQTPSSGAHTAWAHGATPSGLLASRNMAATPPPPITVGDRSQWERLTLAEGIELHVRRPTTRMQQKALERLLTAARQILIEEQS